MQQIGFAALPEPYPADSDTEKMLQQFADFAIDFSNQSVFCCADALRQKQADVVFTSDKTSQADIEF
ncbi:MAG: hypothetical protein ACPGEF_06310, partial [Endozoicomonas sp.]